LLLANGFTDDIFPVGEMLRYYNLERSLYPSDPIALFDFDGGHMRGQNKPADLALLGQDTPYTRPSNGVFSISISVSNLQLRLPVHEIPGAPGTPQVVKRRLGVGEP
jgi:hypothetical protein